VGKLHPVTIVIIVIPHRAESPVRNLLFPGPESGCGRAWRSVPAGT
jgi:hypothetical protein